MAPPVSLLAWFLGPLVVWLSLDRTRPAASGGPICQFGRARFQCRAALHGCRSCITARVAGNIGAPESLIGFEDLEPEEQVRRQPYNIWSVYDSGSGSGGSGSKLERVIC